MGRVDLYIFYPDDFDTYVMEFRVRWRMADIRSVNSGWYQMVDGKEKALELPAMVKADQDGKIILYNNTLNPEDKNKVLSINGLQEQPEVWMGKKCLFRYEEKDFLKNDHMRGKMWADVC